MRVLAQVQWLDAGALWISQGEPLPTCLPHGQREAVIVVHLADVVPIVELAQILIQVRFADMMIDTVDPALDDCEVRFHRVSRDADAVLVANIFFLRVIHGAVLLACWCSR